MLSSNIYISWDKFVGVLSIESSYNYVRELLELHQKYFEQHPELYDNITLVVELPLSMAEYEDMYTWFIPFSLKININLVLFNDIMQMKSYNKCIIYNFFQLHNIGVGVKINC
ncbi:hypothetical protein [Aeromonas hydrophila]|uniref:hypothetical protein n=1 Tax=Aeromonas hydrophila TaxID=644 RepID=UPI0019202D00|nr:hypothetical protein [Aeromonas hydrophila]MBL0560962.1 hypothetical protein [Aeromonas hydrophila]